MKAQQGFEENKKTRFWQNKCMLETIAYSGFIWDVTFKTAVCVCIFLVIRFKRQIANNSNFRTLPLAVMVLECLLTQTQDVCI